MIVEEKTAQALQWIITLLNEAGIPYQIAGGLAAKIYGATRPLQDIDIDIPEEQFDKLAKLVSKNIVFGPAYYQDEHWKLTLMTLDYAGQLIDIGGAHQAEIFNAQTQTWQPFSSDLSQAVAKKINHQKLKVIPYVDLVYYKSLLRREVDLLDLAELESKSSE